MTVVSRPVLGATCVTPSAYVSLPTSTPGMYGDCSGKGPAGWIGTDLWPTPYCKESCNGVGASLFNVYFEPDLQSDPTLLAVLEQNQSEVARYVVAALLNYAAGLVPDTVLRESTIKHIWNEFATSGSFTPMLTASWNAEEIVDYLKSTMTSG